MPALPPKTFGGPLVLLRSRRPSATTASGASRPYGADVKVAERPRQLLPQEGGANGCVVCLPCTPQLILILGELWALARSHRASARATPAPVRPLHAGDGHSRVGDGHSEVVRQANW